MDKSLIVAEKPSVAADIAKALGGFTKGNGCYERDDAIDQWAYLAAIQPMVPHDIEPTILRATGGVHPLDVTFIDDEDLATPWKRESASTKKLSGAMPTSLTVTLANLIDQLHSFVGIGKRL